MEVIKKNGVQILNLDGRRLKDHNYDYQPTDKRAEDKLYGCTFPLCLDLVKLYKAHPEEFIKMKKKEEIKSIRTEAIINVNITEPTRRVTRFEGKQEGNIVIVSPRMATETSVIVIREELYRDGFTYKGVRYVKYKRSSAKVKNGSCLFIKESLLQEMKTWSRIGLDFDNLGEPFDTTSLYAYEALSTSSLDANVNDGFLHIESHQILIIPDCETEISFPAMVTKIAEKDGVPIGVAEYEADYIKKQKLWDGQCLIDKSIIPVDNEACMYLLRNRFFKSAGFSANIQDFFRDNGITEVTDEIRHIKLRAEDIKVITTPSSLKLFKFAGLMFGEGNPYCTKYNDPTADCLQYWLDNLEADFGVCKNEHGTYNDKQRLSYQMINSLDLSRGDIAALAHEQIQTIIDINNDPEKLMEHLDGSHSHKKDFVKTIYDINPDFAKTDYFYEFRGQEVDELKKSLKSGRIIVDGDYCVLLGNPIEMLKTAAFGSEHIDRYVGECTINKENINGMAHIHCTRFEDGETVTCFRNPHICSGNVLCATNVVYPDADKYLNLSRNIVVLNTIGTDVYDRLQGADTDSDTCLITNNSILVDKARECVGYPTPINGISFKAKPRTPNPKDDAFVDEVIRNNLIGRVVNLSQVLNSLLFDIKEQYRDDPNRCKDITDKIYSMVTILSSLSQVEIDKSKKYYEKKDLDIEGTMSQIVEDIYDMARSGLIDRLIYRAVFTDEDRAKYRRELDKAEGEKKQHMIHILREVEELEKAISDADSESKHKLTVQYYDYLLKQKLGQKIKVRPVFMQVLTDESEKLIFEGFCCPMDYLHKEVQAIPNAKKREKKKIQDIIVPSNNKGDHQLMQEIERKCELFANHIQAVRLDRSIDRYETAEECERCYQELVLYFEDLQLDKVRKVRRSDKYSDKYDTVVELLHRHMFKYNADGSIKKIYKKDKAIHYLVLYGLHKAYPDMIKKAIIPRSGS